MLPEHWERLGSVQREHFKNIHLREKGPALILNREIGLWFYQGGINESEKRLVIAAPKSFPIYQKYMISQHGEEDQRPLLSNLHDIGLLSVGFNKEDTQRNVIYIGESKYRLSHIDTAEDLAMHIRVESPQRISFLEYKGSSVKDMKYDIPKIRLARSLPEAG